MKFSILGPTSLHVDGTSVALGAAKQRGLLAVLLCHAQQAVPLDVIVDLLWGDDAGSDHRTSLYAIVSRTRSALHAAGVDVPLVRVTMSPAYRLDVSRQDVDYHQFRRLVRDAREHVRHHEYDTAAALLFTAVDLWTGDPLVELVGARAEHLRRDMTDELLSAQTLLVRLMLRLDRVEAALVVLDPLVRRHPLDEGLARDWVRVLCAVGRADDARAFLRRFHQRFRAAMRVAPDVRLPDTDQAPAGLPSSVPAGLADAGTADDRVRRPRQLPRDITDFVGQGALLAELDRLTDPDQPRANVVIISGMPGVGKTTLVVHWAHRRRRRFPDGQLYINANGYGPAPRLDPDEGVTRLLHALTGTVPRQATPDTAEDRRDRYHRLLDGRRVLVVLDNVSDADQARPLIPTSATCVTVITSRTRLTSLAVHDGVRSLSVAPLSDDESVTLVSGVIGADRAANEPAATRHIAQAAAGLPLALRVIAEHVAERPRATVADLGDELAGHLLSNDADEDDTNLNTVFAWSYTTLSGDAARLFRLVGLHPGTTVSVEAAAAMAGLDQQHAYRLLDHLARMHLVNHDTIRRYRFHDLLHQYAASRARAEDPDDGLAAQQRLLGWYLLTASAATTRLAPYFEPVPDLPAPQGIMPMSFSCDDDAMGWYEAERDNLGHVARWALAHGQPRFAWQIPATAHEVLDRFGRPDDLIELQTIAVDAARRDSHPGAQIGTLINLATAHFATGDLDRAAHALAECVQVARAAVDVDAEVIATVNLASVHVKRQSVDQVVALCTRALALCREHPNRECESAALHHLGTAYRQAKQYERASEHLRASLAIRESMGYPRAQMAIHTELAVLHLEQDDLQAARHVRSRGHRTRQPPGGHPRRHRPPRPRRG